MCDYGMINTGRYFMKLDYSVFSKAGFSDSAAPQVFLLVEKLSRIHAEHQETSSAPHAAWVMCDHRGEGEADDTGEHTCGGQLVAAQMLAGVTQGHAELQERNGGKSGEGAVATPDLR